MSYNQNLGDSPDRETPPQEMNEVIIGLLGRIAFPSDTLISIISKKKQDPNAYIRGYNLCDGKHTLTQIADEMKISKGTLSPIVNNWKEMGIVYEVRRGGQKFFKRLYKLDAPRFSKRTAPVKVEATDQDQKELSNTLPEQSQSQ